MNELKVGFGRFMVDFYNSLSPMTKAIAEFKARGVAKSIVYAPSTMVDSAEDMLASWRSNDNAGNGTQAPFLPVIIVATGKDYLPASGDFNIQIADDQYVMLPDDPKKRIFKMRQMSGDRRAQVCIFAADEPTSRSLAAQFALFVARAANRRFVATYRFAGFDLPFPVMLETTDVPAMNVATEQKNLSILAIDLSLRESIPVFTAPAAGEPNDGLGTNGNPEDPSGYLMMNQVKSLDINTGVIKITEDV